MQANWTLSSSLKKEKKFCFLLAYYSNSHINLEKVRDHKTSFVNGQIIIILGFAGYSPCCNYLALPM